MCDYNKSNGKQVKEMVLICSQNWLFPATVELLFIHAIHTHAHTHSSLHLYAYISFSDFSPYGLLQSIEESPLCCSVGPYW